MVQAAPESSRGTEYACVGFGNTVWKANLSTGIDPVRVCFELKVAFLEASRDIAAEQEAA